MDGKHDILKKYTAEAQLEYLENWFREGYEDPIINCCSDEGYPVFKHGGPFDAYEVLECEFGEYVPESLLRELADRLSLACLEWEGIPCADEDENDDFDLIDDPYGNFETALEICRTIADESLSEITKVKIFGLLYCNLITALEVYLLEAFKKRLFCKEAPAVLLREAFSALDATKRADNKQRKPKEQGTEKLIDRLNDHVWHRFGKNRILYKTALDLDLPDESLLKKALAVRHDVTHRNFKTKQGEQITIDKPEFLELCEKIHAYVRQIEFPDEKPLLPGQRRVSRINPGIWSTEIVTDGDL